MKKIIIILTILAAVLTTGIYASETSKLTSEEYKEYVFQLVDEMNNVPLEISIENFLKYGLDKGTLQPIKDSLALQKEIVENNLLEINNFKFKDESTYIERDHLVEMLSSIIDSIDKVVAICDQVIVETSTLKSLSIIGYDGSEALSELCSKYDELNMLLE